MPDRPPHRGWRPHRAGAAVGAGPRDRGPRRCAGRRRHRPRARCAGRRALAGAQLRRLPTLRGGAREPVRPARLHRLHPQRRLCRVLRCRCALCLSAGRDRRSGGAGAAALCRADRISHPAPGGRSRRSRALRVRGGRTYPVRGGGSMRSAGPGMPPRRTSRAGWGPSGPGARKSCRPSRSTPR